MSTTNTGSQVIIWKYRTQLKAQELGTLISHISNIGLCTEIQPTLDSGTVNIPVFSALVKPSDIDDDVLVKITTTEVVSITGVTSSYSAIGMHYTFNNDGSADETWYADFDLLTSLTMSSYKATYPGAIILAYIYTYQDTLTISSVGQDYSDLLVQEKGWNPDSWIAPISPLRNSNTVSTSKVELRKRGNEQNTDDVLVLNGTSFLFQQPTSTVDLDGISSGCYVALGYAQCSSTLSVLNSASSLESLSISGNSQLLGVVCYSGDVHTSCFINASTIKRTTQVTEYMSKTGCACDSAKLNGLEPQCYLKTSATDVTTQCSTTSADYFPTFVTANNSTATASTVYTGGNLKFNPNTGLLTATTFKGTFCGQAYDNYGCAYCTALNLDTTTFACAYNNNQNCVCLAYCTDKVKPAGTNSCLITSSSASVNFQENYGVSNYYTNIDEQTITNTGCPIIAQYCSCIEDRSGLTTCLVLSVIGYQKSITLYNCCCRTATDSSHICSYLTAIFKSIY